MLRHHCEVNTALTSVCVEGKPWTTILKCYSTEISLLLKFGSSLQHNRKLVSYGTLWIAQNQFGTIQRYAFQICNTNLQNEISTLVLKSMFNNYKVAILWRTS